MKTTFTMLSLMFLSTTLFLKFHNDITLNRIRNVVYQTLKYVLQIEMHIYWVGKIASALISIPGMRVIGGTVKS